MTRWSLFSLCKKEDFVNCTFGEEGPCKSAKHRNAEAELDALIEEKLQKIGAVRVVAPPPPPMAPRLRRA